MKLLKKGDRIRLKVRTIFGWKGIGTVIEDQLHENSAVRFKKDENGSNNCTACRHEVAKMRK